MRGSRPRTTREKLRVQGRGLRRRQMIPGARSSRLLKNGLDFELFA
jgi:hypothetical protein